MLIDTLTTEFKDALADRLTAYELVEFLDIPIEDIIEQFEDEIIQHLDDVQDFARLRGFDNNNEDS